MSLQRLRLSIDINRRTNVLSENFKKFGHFPYNRTDRITIQQTSTGVSRTLEENAILGKSAHGYERRLNLVICSEHLNTLHLGETFYLFNHEACDRRQNVSFCRTYGEWPVVSEGCWRTKHKDGPPRR